MTWTAFSAFGPRKKLKHSKRTSTSRETGTTFVFLRFLPSAILRSDLCSFPSKRKPLAGLIQIADDYRVGRELPFQDALGQAVLDGLLEEALEGLFPVR